jgi:hypothetical protein
VPHAGHVPLEFASQSVFGHREQRVGQVPVLRRRVHFALVRRRHDVELIDMTFAREAKSLRGNGEQLPRNDLASRAKSRTARHHGAEAPEL